MRVYLPATFAMLESLQEDGRIHARNGWGFAATPELIEFFTSGDEEEIEAVAFDDASSPWALARAAEWAIFAGAEGGEVIALSSDDEVEGGEDGSDQLLRGADRALVARLLGLRRLAHGVLWAWVE